MKRIPITRIVVVAAILVWSLFPIYWTLNTSFMRLSAADSKPAHLVPSPFTWANYGEVFGIYPGQQNLWSQFEHVLINSGVESAATTLLTLIVSSFAAYAFARLEFRLKAIIFYVVLGTLALPAYATLIPLYRIMANVGLVNTYPGIVLVYTSGFVPLAMWIWNRPPVSTGPHDGQSSLP
jgi:multiple sugar transport system permease protein